jgi:hypothetical protein
VGTLARVLPGVAREGWTPERRERKNQGGGLRVRFGINQDSSAGSRPSRSESGHAVMAPTALSHALQAGLNGSVMELGAHP